MQYNKFNDWNCLFHFSCTSKSNHRFFVSAQHFFMGFSLFVVRPNSYIRWPSAINFHFILNETYCSMFAQIQSSRWMSSIFVFFCAVLGCHVDGHSRTYVQFWINVIAFHDSCQAYMVHCQCPIDGEFHFYFRINSLCRHSAWTKTHSNGCYLPPNDDGHAIANSEERKKWIKMRVGGLFRQKDDKNVTRCEKNGGRSRKV